MQGRNRDADVEKGHVVTEEGKGRTNWENSTDIYTRPCVKQRARKKLLRAGEAQLGSL